MATGRRFSLRAFARIGFRRGAWRARDSRARFSRLLSFNVGVEAGQLAVLVLAFVTVGWFRNKPWYRARVTIPMSLIIAMIGLYWVWERP